MHATHNGIIQAFFNRITADTGPTAWFIGEFGVALVPFTVAVAWYCWHHPPTRTHSDPAALVAPRSLNDCRLHVWAASIASSTIVCFGL